MKATIEERGNGFAGVGEYVTENGNVYRVIKLIGPIHTGQAGMPNYIHAEVEEADWDDLEEGAEPYCTAVVEVA